MGRLDGRVVIVTGGAQGIGKAYSEGLAREGASVVVADINASAADALVRALGESGGDTLAVTVDVSDPEQAEDMARATIDRFGRIDGLVNNAAIFQRPSMTRGPFDQISVEEWDRLMAVNLRGAYFMTQAVAQGLVQAGKPGSLINISSQMGHVGGVDRAVYCASKHGVEGFTKAMAVELGPHGIRVNTICPTFIHTPLTAATFDNPERLAWIREKIKLGRVGEVEDIMGAVVFLASEASALVTGTALLIDGGWTAD